MGEEVPRDTLSARDVIQICRPDAHRRAGGREAPGVRAQHRGDRRGTTRRFCSAGRSCMAIPRGMKPKQYRRQLWELGRLMVRTSRLVPRDQVPEPGDPPPDRPPARGGGGTASRWSARSRAMQRKLETWPGGARRGHQGSAQGAARLRPAAAAAGGAVRRLGGGTAAHARDHHARRTRKRRPPRRS